MDIGYLTTTITPVIDGIVIEYATIVLEVAGKCIDEYLLWLTGIYFCRLYQQMISNCWV